MNCAHESSASKSVNTNAVFILMVEKAKHGTRAEWWGSIASFHYAPEVSYGPSKQRSLEPWWTGRTFGDRRRPRGPFWNIYHLDCQLISLNGVKVSLLLLFQHYTRQTVLLGSDEQKVPDALRLRFVYLFFVFVSLFSRTHWNAGATLPQWLPGPEGRWVSREGSWTAQLVCPGTRAAPDWAPRPDCPLRWPACWSLRSWSTSWATFSSSCPCTGIKSFGMQVRDLKQPVSGEFMQETNKQKHEKILFTVSVWIPEQKHPLFTTLFYLYTCKGCRQPAPSPLHMHYIIHTQFTYV